MSIRSDILIESKSLRESVIDHVDVLDKVKRLIMLPDDIHVTVEMVADFYEVSNDVIRKVSARKKEELESDGMRTIHGKELKDMKSFCGLSRNVGRLTLFNRRSVLRVGMLIEESGVASAIRSKLLDIEEDKSPNVSIVQPTGVEDLIIMQAHSVKELKLKVSELEVQQKQDREKLDVVNDTISSMAENLTAIPDSSLIVKTVNEIMRWTRLEHEDIFKKSYEILKQKHGFDVVVRVKNERDRIQGEYFEKKGKYYADSTIKNKVNGIDVIVRNGWVLQYFEVLTGWLAKEKTKSTLRLVN